MSDYFGIDLSPSNVRWMREDVNAEVSVRDFPRLSGCPSCPRRGKKSEYDAIDSWGDPFAFRGHNFTRERTEKGVEFDNVGNFLFVDADKYEWLRPFFSRECKAHPPVLPDAVLTVAIPNETTSRLQDDVLANIPTGYGKTYLLWRPIALAIDWLEDLKAHYRDPSEYIDKRIFTLDFDGGYPEVAEVGLCRHKVNGELVVPVRKPLKRNCRIVDGWHSDMLTSAVLVDVPDRDQLMKGLFAETLQRDLESDKRFTDVWMRESGMWKSRRIRFADDLGAFFWSNFKKLVGVLNGILGRDDVLICNGWVARRYSDQLKEVFGNRGAEIVIARPESICAGACIFSKKMANREPTYYDVLPDYEFWDGKAGVWRHLFDTSEPVEPGSEHMRDDIHVKVDKNNDNLSFYVRNADEATENEDARRLKVSFASFQTNDIPLRLSVSVRLARGSAEMALEMEDGRQPPVFLVDEKPSRILRFKYTVGDSGSITGVPEPLHKGMLEPQPVLGRIYDSKENVKMVWLLLQDARTSECRAAVERYRQESGFTKRDILITARVGYEANPRQPTRGLLGTKRLPNMPEIDELARALAEKSALGGLDEKKQNYCHSAATEKYKASVRAKLKEKATQSSWNFCYAPGYVLGDKPGDLELLLGYLVEQPTNGYTTGKLWWSVFRMLCWHPESKVEDTDLLERALWKIVDEDAMAASSTERKYVILGILYALRAREHIDSQGNRYDLPSRLTKELIHLLYSGVLANEPFPKTMLPNFELDGSLSDYVRRFINRKDTLRDRELGAQMGCV